MDMNQRLFDECVQKYEAQRQKEKEALKQREDKWNKVQNMAGAQEVGHAAVQGWGYRRINKKNSVIFTIHL